jgi:hypothetical protein
MSDTLTASATANTTTMFTISAIVGNQLSVEFTGLASNRPSTYGNFLVVWTNQDAIPYNNVNPNGFVEISGDNSQGSQVFEGLTVDINTSYVVGYAVGPKINSGGQLWGNVCSTGFVPASGASTYQVPTITSLAAQANSVTMNFLLPDGATPHTNGAWVGIWQSGQASYNTPPLASNSINVDFSSGGAAINGLNMLRGQIYTVALFTSGYKAGSGGTNIQTAMACTATLTT